MDNSKDWYPAKVSIKCNKVKIVNRLKLEHPNLYKQALRSRTPKDFDKIIENAKSAQWFKDDDPEKFPFKMTRVDEQSNKYVYGKTDIVALPKPKLSGEPITRVGETSLGTLSDRPTIITRCAAVPTVPAVRKESEYKKKGKKPEVLKTTADKPKEEPEHEAMEEEKPGFPNVLNPINKVMLNTVLKIQKERDDAEKKKNEKQGENMEVETPQGKPMIRIEAATKPDEDTVMEDAFDEFRGLKSERQADKDIWKQKIGEDSDGRPIYRKFSTILTYPVVWDLTMGQPAWFCDPHYDERNPSQEVVTSCILDGTGKHKRTKELIMVACSVFDGIPIIPDRAINTFKDGDKAELQKYLWETVHPALEHLKTYHGLRALMLPRAYYDTFLDFEPNDEDDTFGDSGPMGKYMDYQVDACNRLSYYATQLWRKYCLHPKPEAIRGIRQNHSGAECNKYAQLDKYVKCSPFSRQTAERFADLQDAKILPKEDWVEKTGPPHEVTDILGLMKVIQTDTGFDNLPPDDEPFRMGVMVSGTWSSILIQYFTNVKRNMEVHMNTAMVREYHPPHYSSQINNYVKIVEAADYREVKPSGEYIFFASADDQSGHMYLLGTQKKWIYYGSSVQECAKMLVAFAAKRRELGALPFIVGFDVSNFLVGTSAAYPLFLVVDLNMSKFCNRGTYPLGMNRVEYYMQHQFGMGKCHNARRAYHVTIALARVILPLIDFSSADVPYSQTRFIQLAGHVLKGGKEDLIKF